MLPYTHKQNAKETLSHLATSALWRQAERKASFVLAQPRAGTDPAKSFHERVASQ